MTIREQLLEEELVGQPVRALQYMLRRLSEKYEFLPELQPNGRFDERTLEAVMRFQKEFSPAVTGVVDRQTWTDIRDKWLEVERELAPPRQLRGFPANARAAIGESREFLYVIQGMFQALSRIFEGLQEERLDAIHSGNSVDNVLWLQKRAGLPLTGEVDRDTWDALTRLYELFVVRQRQEVIPALGRG